MSVGIVIATYNRADRVGRAIDSGLAQGASVEAIVVVDDGSTDSTPEVLARYADLDPRVEVVRLDSNLGPSTAKNRGMDALAGRVKAVAILDSDDWLSEGAIQDMFRCLVADETVSQVLGYMADVDGYCQGAFRGGSGRFSWDDAICGDPSGDFLRLARAASLDGIRFDERAWGGEGALWARLLRLGDGLVLDRTVAVCDRGGSDRLTDRLGAPGDDERLLVGRIWAMRGILEATGDAMRRRCPDLHYDLVADAAKWSLYSGDRASHRFFIDVLKGSGHGAMAAGLKAASLLPTRARRALLRGLVAVRARRGG